MSRTVEFLCPDGPISDQMILDVVSLVDHVPPEDPAGWTPLERLLVYDWAMRDHLRAAGNRVKRRPCPWILDAVVLEDGPEQELRDRQHWLDATKDALDSMTLQRDELKARVAALESQIKILEGPAVRCPTCREVMTEEGCPQCSDDDEGDESVH